MRVIREYLNKMEIYIQCLQIGKLSIKMSVHSLFICRFNPRIIKIPVGWFVWQDDSKICMEKKGLKVATIFLEKNQVGTITLSITVTYYKAIVINRI